MKKIEIKEISLTTQVGENEVRRMTYADLCKVNLNHMPQEGLLPTQMTERVNLINKFNDVKVGDIVEVEDAEFKTLLDCNQKTRWQMIHNDIVEFNNYILKISK